jgi:2'-5' RNA ligase
MGRSSFQAPRLFVAVRFPDRVHEALEGIAFGPPGASWTNTEQYHLTLRFLGDPSPLSLDAIDRALREVRASSFHVTLKGTGHFPLRGDPEILWAGVEENAMLSSLRNRVEAALTRAGLAPEGRKFHPHVTLANVRSVQPQDVAAFHMRHGLFRMDDIPVQEFHLCSSMLRSGGAEHTVEASYPLEGILEGDA